MKSPKQLIVAINLIAFNDVKAVGTLVYTRRLLSELLKIENVDKDVQFVVYAQRHIDLTAFALPVNRSITIVRVPTMRSAIKRILFEQTFFYLYLRYCDVFFTPTLSMPLFARGKKLFVLHDMVPFVIPGKYSYIRLKYIKAITKLYANVCDRLITVSNNSKQDIIKFLKIKPDKISIVYNSIPFNEPLVNVDVDLSFLNQSHINRPFFLTVSTLQPAKNIDGLIKAFAVFSKLHPQYFLYIVGNKGWGYKPLFDLTKELDMECRVKFLGYVNDENLAALYQGCEGVLYVSLYEGFGLPPLEGFYHGKACVASNTSSIPEVVGEAGLLVDPYDQQSIVEGMECFITVKSELEQKIPQRVDQFNPQTIAKQFLNILRSDK